MNRPVDAIDLAKDSLIAVSSLAAPDVAIPRGVAYESYGTTLETPIRAATTVVLEAAPAGLRRVSTDRSFYATHGKRFFDLVAGIPLLLIATPIILLAVVAVVLTSGWPAFYASTRVGKDGRNFRMWKIRTMRRDADLILQEWLSDEATCEQFKREFKIHNDIRITRVGALLRRTSLDELPQLLNVIRGEMSLVGWRPIVQDELEHYGRESAVLLSMRPGLTGAWQAGRRNEVCYPERVDLELDYVHSSSFAQDLAILTRSLLVPLRLNGR